MVKPVTGIRLAVVALLLAPLLAYAAGLGRLTVNSGLGQPLNAEIEIVSLQAGEEDSLSARLASSEAFRQAGIEMTAALVDVQFSIDRRGGRPVIRIRSTQPINEPFLDMLVELQWATGRLVREYTFLLDPPEYRQPKPAAAAPQPSARPAPEPSVAKPAPRMESRPLISEPPRTAGGPSAGSYEVKKGDTLGAIARQNLPQGVTLNQMLVALFRANQDAFIQGNVNLVRAGRILSIPDREAAVALASEDANRLVQSHMADFAEYKRKLGVAVAAAPAKPAPREREVTGRISPKPEAPAPAESKDQLKLSKADPKAGAAAAKAARDDDRAAREGALKEAQSRVGALEKNVADLQKLVEMKNQQMAEMEKKAAAEKAAAAAAAAAAAKAPPAPAPAAKAPELAKPEPAKPAAKSEPAKPEPAKPEPAKPEPPKAEPAKPEPAKAEPAKAEPAKDAPKPAAKDAPKDAPKDAAKEPAKAAPKAEDKKATPTKAPAPEKNIVEELIEDPVFLMGLGAVLLALVGYGAWAWRKKKKAQSSGFQDSVLGAASGVGGSSVFDAAPAAAPVAAAGAVAAPQVASTASAPAPAPESDEVDPIAEADVYMAYGRDAQAEEILKESLAKDPDRLAVHAKLLEIYANRKDTKSFEQSALKIKSLTLGAGPEWDKAMALGHSIDPGNGLYGSGGATGDAPAAPAAAPTLDFDIGGGGDAAPAAPAAKADAGALDFDLGATSPKVEAKTDFAPGGTLITDSKETQPATPSGLDFDIGGVAPAAEDDGEKTMLLPPRKPAAEKKVDPDQTVAMDFDLNLDLGGAKPEAAAKPADAPIDLGALSLDLGAPAGGGGSTDPKWQEVATKLDLAKAYSEMGDKDGAKELLNEVMKDGDAAQKGQAEQMLAGL
jgi:pilus assembly protein FimV